MKTLPVSALLSSEAADLQISLLTGQGGSSRIISSSRIQKPGLALAGFTEHLHQERVQVFGNTEISYLATLSPERVRAALKDLFQENLACIVVTKSLQPPTFLLELCTEANLCLMSTPHPSAIFIEKVQLFLEEMLTESATLHGVLMDVFGVGVFLLGKSGIGKSEIALDLVMRGHRLVADDVVEVWRHRDELYGQGNALLQHHMEIRGLGIINIKDLFGVASVRDRKKVELVMELTEWVDTDSYDRLGVDTSSQDWLGVTLPRSIVPVRPGRNMTTIVEVAARNHLLKLKGVHSAKDFVQKVSEKIAQPPEIRARFYREEIE